MVDVAYSKERAALFDFSRESFLVNWAAVYTPAESNISSVVDLDGRTVAVMAGSIHTEGENGIKKLAERFSLDIDFIEAKDYREVFSLVADGRAEAGVANRIFGSLFSAEYGLVPTPVIFNPRHLKFAFPKGAANNARLAAAIDRHLRQQKRTPDSFYEKLLYIYLSGMPRGLAAADGTRPGGGKGVQLTAKEREWIQAHSTIRLGIDQEFAPFEYIDKNGEYKGIASSYVALLNERLGLGMRVVPGLRWRDVPPMAKRKEIDVLPCVGKTAQRRQYLRFSLPYASFHRVIITRTDTPFMTGPADLDGLKTAVQANSSHEGYLRENTTITPVVYPDQQTALLAVANGEADAFVGNIASAAYWIRRLSLTNLKVAAPVSNEPQHLYFAVRRDWPELVAIINKGLRSITPEEEEAIRRQWVNIEYKPGISPRQLRDYILQVVGVAAVLLLVILFWNRRLQAEISRRTQTEQALQRARDELEDRVRQRTAMLAEANKELRAEIEHRAETERKLKLAEAQWRNTFNSITDFITVLDRDHTILRTNDAFAAMLGLPPEEVVGRRCHEIFHNQDEPVQGCPHAKSMETGRSHTEEIYDVNRDMHLLVTDSPLFENGELVGSVHIAKDITRQKQAENELKAHRDRLEELVAERTKELSEANRELQQLDRLKSMFIASMSHELRTPLNSIIGFTGIMLQGMTGGLNDKQRDHLGRVYRSAKHLLNLITDVIDISKIEAGRVDVFPEPLELGEVVREAVTAVEPQLQAKDLTLRIAVPRGLAMRTDRKRLLQSLINLLGNAVKFTEQGRIGVTAEAVENGRVRVAVSDTGIGIEPENIPKLFEAFERLDTHLRVKAGGTGLGLYLTKKLVTELLGGKITVESRPGKGSVFSFIIPMDIGTAKEAKENS